MPGLAGEVANLIVALKLDDSGFTGKLNRAAGTLKRLDGGLSQVGRGVGQVGSGLGRLATVGAAAAAGGLAAVVTTAASFEQAFTGVEKTVDGTDEQLAELEQTIRGMARSMPVSFEELSAIGEAGGALGVARDSLDEFIDVVARLAVSTDLSSEQAATALGQLGTVLDLSGSEFEDFADSLVALGNAGASTESQIVEMSARFAASGRSAGLTKEEILALASATASMGIEVEAGGTALSQTFDKITLAIGTGADELDAFTETLGISAGEFKRRWEQDALGTFQDFLAELNKLDQFEQAAVLEEAGITGVRQQRAVRLMAQNIGFLGDQLEIAREASGALDEESQKFFDTSIGQWKILTNNVRDAAATIGAELLPVANELMKDFVEELQKPGTQQGIKDFARDLAGGVRGLVSELKGTDFSGLIGGIKLAAEVAKGAFNAFRALPEPIQQLAIAALVANKVSGGAVGQIAKGLGNIVLGGGKGLAGLFGGMRGQTPASPMFVSVVGPGGLGGGGPLGGPTGRLGGAAKLLGGLTTVGLAAIVADALEEPMEALADEINKGIFGPEGGSILGDFKVNDLQWPFGPKNTPTILPELFGGNGLLGGTGNPAPPPGSRTLVNPTATRPGGGRLGIEPIVIKDGGPVEQSISELREETRQLNNPLLGIREINARSALGIESTRDEVRDLQAQNRASLAAIEARERESAQRLSDARAAIQEQRLAITSGFATSNSKLGVIAAKPDSTTVNVTTNVNAQISTYDATYVQSVVQTIRNNSGNNFREGLN